MAFGVQNAHLSTKVPFGSHNKVAKITQGTLNIIMLAPVDSPPSGGVLLTIHLPLLWCVHTRARQRQYNKTNVEPVYSYDAFHTGPATTGVKGIIGMHRFNICLVAVLSLSFRCLALVGKHH